MSKSKPDSAIFMTDSEEEIKQKIFRAYCPEKQLQENPVVEYCKYIIFEKFKEMRIERPKKFGGDLRVSGFSELSDIYKKGELHPQDLKSAVSEYINKLIEPVREHFEKSAKAKRLLDQVKKFEITR